MGLGQTYLSAFPGGTWATQEMVNHGLRWGKGQCGVLSLLYGSHQTCTRLACDFDPTVAFPFRANMAFLADRDNHVATLTMDALKSIRTLDDGTIDIVNQLLLPHTIQYVKIRSIEEAHDAIKSMKVCHLSLIPFALIDGQIRGAPAIGALASLSIATTLSAAIQATPRPDFLGSPTLLQVYVVPQLDYLHTARPTAVNLGAATRRLAKLLSEAVTKHQQQPEPRTPDADAALSIATDLIAEAKLIGGEDKAQNITMSRLGGEWLHTRIGGSGKYLNVLTICNTGSLATSVISNAVPRDHTLIRLDLQGYGTALGFITYLHEQGLLERAYFTQTAPYHQGSR